MLVASCIVMHRQHRLHKLYSYIGYMRLHGYIGYIRLHGYRLQGLQSTCKKVGHDEPLSESKSSKALKVLLFL